MWGQRYSTEAYVYGTEPNDFLVAQFGSLPAGWFVLGKEKGKMQYGSRSRAAR